MQKYRAIVQYRGTRYSGWQVQKDRDTIQGCLKAATEKVTGEAITWVGAGRTDAGVHSLGQCAHFRLEQARQAGQLQRSLNGVLPPDIRVRRLQQADQLFHAQKQALKKRYAYRIFNGPVLSPFLPGLVYHAFRPLDVAAMQQAARLLTGTWNLRGFAAASTSVRTFTRTIHLSQLRRRRNQLRYIVEANGFLHHMVRNIVGTLLEVGTGLRPPEDMLRILASRDRRNAGRTASPQGLYLVRVWYRE